jgi:hypothetical protein
MAKIETAQTRLLGFAPVAGLEALVAALNAVAGPSVRDLRAPAGGLAALLQAEPGGTLMGRGRGALAAGLLTVQRRLEIGCQAGPFLAMNPASACCASTEIEGLLDAEWAAIGPALACHGARQQWDIALKWDPKDVVARHRAEIAPAAALGHQALAEAVGAVLRRERDKLEAALLVALRPAVEEFASGGAACTDASVTVTVLVPAGGDAAVEAALDGMAPVDGVSIDMRGPLPPLSFAAVRIVLADERAVTAAWRTLGLANRIDLADLHRQWRLRAAQVHPDRAPAEHDVSVSDVTEAYRLLRGLLPPGADATLAELLGRGGPRLVLPEVSAPDPARVQELMA